MAQTPTTLVKQEILYSLASTEPEVACLSGHWGVGKTYAWNEFIRQAKESKGIALRRYAYVSLFGINSLEELKYALFESTIQCSQIGAEPTFATVKANISAISEAAGRKATSFLQQLPFVKTHLGGLAPLWFLSVRKQIICLDDIERRGRGLSIRDVLGLVSFLRERRDCKIMLILNDEALEIDKADFDMYYEKVVEVTLAFAPTPAECANIALSGQSKPLKFLSECCVALGIPNIRTIKRIERMLRKIEPWFQNMDEQVWKQAVQSATLLGWAFYDKLTAPSLEYILDRDPTSAYLGAEKVEITDQEAAWNVLLREVDFHSADELDLALLDGMRVGFFDRERVEKHALELDKQFKGNRLNDSLRNAWSLYRNSFQPNEDEVVDALYNSTSANLEAINIFDIDAAVTVLRELARSDLADDLIRRRVAQMADAKDQIELDESLFRRKIGDPALIAALKLLMGEEKTPRSPRDVLVSVATNQAWSDADIDTLASISVDEYRSIFKACIGKDLKKLVSACLQFNRTIPSSDKKREIVSRAEAALKLIARESRINRLRVAEFGVTVDDPDEG